nr:hypothetical protein CFP56_55359 [Quercus suber]
MILSDDFKVGYRLALRFQLQSLWVTRTRTWTLELLLYKSLASSVLRFFFGSSESIRDGKDSVILIYSLVSATNAHIGFLAVAFELPIVPSTSIFAVKSTTALTINYKQDSTTLKDNTRL